MTDDARNHEREDISLHMYVVKGIKYWSIMPTITEFIYLLCFSALVHIPSSLSDNVHKG
jgi:hypothetical protein